MKPIARFEGRYSLTETGQIFNHANNTFLTPIKNPNGYLKVGLAHGQGKQTQLSIHRLVALHYIPNPYEHPQVNHINGDKTDNRVENLEWCTSKENMLHAYKTGLRSGYMSADDKEKYLQEILNGIQVNDLALRIGRRAETLHSMLRETAKRLGIHDQWAAVMKENRRAAAIRNLAQINNKHPN